MVSTEGLVSKAPPVTGSLVLLTELYPPAVGGSATLYQEIYGRMDGPLIIVTEPRVPAPRFNGVIVHHRVSTPEWGVIKPSALWHHVRTAAVLKRVSAPRRTVIHCGRALPEGIAAWIHGGVTGTPYVCWSHGEDLATALLSREQSFCTARVYARARCVIANSGNTARLVENFGVAREKIRVVYPGVDSDRFSPANKGEDIRQRYAPMGERVLLSVGRLQRRKGHDLVIKTLPRLSVSRGVKYLIVGDGEERNRLEELAQVCGVVDRVIFAGAVPEAELPNYYAACDVFIMPNRVDRGDIEGFGIVFLEAASSGRAVIGGNSGGVPEAVEEGVTGVLVSGTDIEELARSIERLCENDILRSALGEAGRRRVLQRSIHEEALTRVR